MRHCLARVFDYNQVTNAQTGLLPASPQHLRRVTLPCPDLYKDFWRAWHHGPNAYAFVERATAWFAVIVLIYKILFLLHFLLLRP